MIRYKKNFFKQYRYGEQDIIPCAVCNSPAVDLHHIIFKSQGGSDEVSNLCPICVNCHKRAHFLKKPYLTQDAIFKFKDVFEKNRLKELENFI